MAMELRAEITIKVAKAVLKELFHDAPAATKQQILGIRSRDYRSVQVSDSAGNVWKISQIAATPAGPEGVCDYQVMILDIELDSDRLVNYRYGGIPYAKWCDIFDEDGWLNN